MECEAFDNGGVPSRAETTKKYRIPADSASALALYNGVRTAVCGCVSNNISTTMSLAAYIVLIEAWKYLK
ncbi:MAG: hypothetical protein ABIA12_01385 [Candidatus Aenigmatarchaeota archaeon]